MYSDVQCVTPDNADKPLLLVYVFTTVLVIILECMLSTLNKQFAVNSRHGVPAAACQLSRNESQGFTRIKGQSFIQGVK